MAIVFHMNHSIALPLPASPSRPFPVPRPSRSLMWALGLVNRWCVLRGYLQVRDWDFPRADRERLRMAVNPDTAAFIGPNHPEFGVDWMIDKELSTHVAPRMASWAAHSIVNSAPHFWTRNNLISNNGGDAATEYSVEWALRGHGVLLHPEGKVHWTSNVIHPLFNGIAKLATEAGRRAAADGTHRRVFIVPVVWKLRYTTDISDALLAEMTMIESALALPRETSLDVAKRFQALQENLLARQMQRLGFAGEANGDFFERQNVFRDHLLCELQSRYLVEPADSIGRTIHRLARAISAKRKEAGHKNAALDEDAKKIAEAERLCGFLRDAYGTVTLSQEQIAESLKRIRLSLVARGFRNAVHNFLPTSYGPRVAHVRVPDPIPVNELKARGDEAERKAYVRWLVDQTRVHMQYKLDAINRQIADDVSAFSHRNPFI